jgi:uncharacterized protein YbbC (DUF1343 family)
MIIALLLFMSAPAASQSPYPAAQKLDALIEDAVRGGRIPGAVVWIGQPGRVLFKKPYGNRALDPTPEEMTLDTIFDAASLTKVMATSASFMKLVEEGKVRLNDPVTAYLPSFQGGKTAITVRQLLTHFSGLRPDVDLKPVWSGYETGVNLALIDKPVAEPGARFIYSDINFILLGEIVRVITGKPLDVYAKEAIFEPLGMRETGYRPAQSLRARIAPTERVDGEILRGVVHDPTTRYMGGVAGHAGVFTTAADLSRFAEMMLNGGQLGGVRIVSAATAKKFTEPQSPPHQPVLRGLGWDIDSPYSGNRGDLFPIGSYGHTGFTGTSLWIDPVSKTYVILLANSVHPKLRPPITSLRGRVATIAAAAAGISSQSSALTSYLETANETPPRRAADRAGSTLTGLDVLVSEEFVRLKNKRVGLITNHTGLTRDGRRNIDAMLAGGVKLTALFSPEHGIAGVEDKEEVAHGKDEATGLQVWSLYKGKDRRPSEAMLREIDVLVFDIQDIGTRFYTYISTMKNAMQAAGEAKKRFVVLDRPNPLGGLRVEGPVIDPDLLSFVGCTRIPLLHGMTVGELARFIQGEDQVVVELDVVAMRDWRRSDWWDSTGLTWVDPSPNMRSLNAALLYAGVGMLEYAKNYSVGRGTDAPFEQVGADWIRGVDLAAHLNRRAVPGVRAYPTILSPKSSHFAGKRVEGVRLVITDRQSFSSYRLGLEIAAALQKLYPGKFDFRGNAKLIGSLGVIQALESGKDAGAIEGLAADGLRAFRERRERYLVYK